MNAKKGLKNKNRKTNFRSIKFILLDLNVWLFADSKLASGAKPLLHYIVGVDFS